MGTARLRAAITYRVLEPPFDAEALTRFTQLAAELFGEYAEEEGTWRLENMPRALLCLAVSGAQPVAFKAGYALSQRRFYSWLGGVQGSHRRLGIASELMRRQHHWLRTREFSTVETRVETNNGAMARLNLRHGFVAVGSVSQGDSVRTIYEKTL